jgi:hypothetical protein
MVRGEVMMNNEHFDVIIVLIFLGEYFFKLSSTNRYQKYPYHSYLLFLLMRPFLKQVFIKYLYLQTSKLSKK